jgi:hypothetical protein
MSEDSTESTESTEKTERIETTERVGTGAGDGTEQTTWFGQWPAPEEQEETRQSGFHPLQVGYLVAGLLCLGGALQWLLVDQGVMQLGDGSIALSVLLIAAGAAGLVASLAKALRRG